MKFDDRVSRREFCKLCLAAAAGISALPSLLKNSASAAGFERKKGLIVKKEAMWWEKAGKFYVCRLCPNNCTLREGVRSVCLVREPEGGRLNTLVYGNPTSLHVDPVEKKPLFHFLPGKPVFSLATAGCNFSCLNCQNWEISQSPPEDTLNYRLMPEETVRTAVHYKCEMIAYTYSEPSVFYEYMLDTAKIAREKNIRNISVTNGYINLKPLDKLCEYLDAANVDLKGFSDDFYLKVTEGRLKPVLDSIVRMKANGVHVEITNLVIPGYNDSDKMIKELCSWIVSNAGKDTPLHFSRFHPMYKMRKLYPTPAETLKRARKIAHDTGVEYVYIGNLPVEKADDTVCPVCGKTVIQRTGYRIDAYKIKEGACAYCKTKVSGVWE